MRKIDIACCVLLVTSVGYARSEPEVAEFLLDEPGHGSCANLRAGQEGLEFLLDERDTEPCPNHPGHHQPQRRLRRNQVNGGLR